MPPAVGGGIRYMTVGGVVGAGCIPLPVPETHPDLYEIALCESYYPPPGFGTYVETGIILTRMIIVSLEMLCTREMDFRREYRRKMHFFSTACKIDMSSKF